MSPPIDHAFVPARSHVRLASDTKVQWTTRTGAGILSHAVTSRRGPDSFRAFEIRVCICPPQLIKSGLPWRGAPCPPSGCWSARSPDHFHECRTNALRWRCRWGRDCYSPVCPSKWLQMRSSSLGLSQQRWHCCLGQPCSARATRSSRGSGPLTASDAESAFNSRPSRSSLAVESPSRSAMRLTRSRRRWFWESLYEIRSFPSHSWSRSRWATFLWLSSTAGMRAAGRRYGYISLVWSAIAIGAALAIMAGYVGVGSLSLAWPPRLQAFGAGALLAMAAETIIPEAFHNSPRFSGLLAAFGFGLLLLVDATTR